MLYIASTNGMVRNMHFCMNELSGSELSLSANENKKCDRCGMVEKEKGCCSHEQSIVKLDSNHQSSEVTFEVPIFFLISLELPNFNPDVLATSLSNHAVNNFLEPSSVPIYLMDCSFLI